MITVPEALMRAVIDDPADDLPRLAFADWCEEAGQAERAEFVRVQVALARIDPRPWHEECDSISACPCYRLQVRQRGLIDACGYGWCDGLFGSGWEVSGGRKEGATIAAEYFSDGWYRPAVLTFTRGFISRVKLPQDAWLEHGPAIIEAHPVERVELSDKKPAAHRGAWVWARLFGDFAHYPHMIDGRLFDCFGTGMLDPTATTSLHRYAAKKGAIDALSDACLTYASREARKRRRKEARRAAHP